MKLDFSQLDEWKFLWREPQQQVHDLALSTALAALFHSEELVAAGLALRGGTALAKLYHGRIQRFSEDIDLVVTDRSRDAREILDLLASTLAPVLGSHEREILPEPGQDSASLLWNILCPLPSAAPVRLKVEVNLYEFQRIEPLVRLPILHTAPFPLPPVTSFSLNELLGTKMRALWARSRMRGRDLFDLWSFLDHPDFDAATLATAFAHYMQVADRTATAVPTAQKYEGRVKLKMRDPDFAADVDQLSLPARFSMSQAWGELRRVIIPALEVNRPQSM